MSNPNPAPAAAFSHRERVEEEQNPAGPVHLESQRIVANLRETQRILAQALVDNKKIGARLTALDTNEPMTQPQRDQLASIAGDVNALGVRIQNAVDSIK